MFSGLPSLDGGPSAQTAAKLEVFEVGGTFTLAYICITTAAAAAFVVAVFACQHLAYFSLLVCMAEGLFTFRWEGNELKAINEAVGGNYTTGKILQVCARPLRQPANGMACHSYAQSISQSQDNLTPPPAAALCCTAQVSLTLVHIFFCVCVCVGMCCASALLPTARGH